ncbi:MAG: tetratricopeptide (TPR) repeat protein, partial [Myxococcota bacterium]
DAQVSLARRYHERGQSLTALDELRSTLASTPRHLGARLLRAEVLADVQALGAAQGHLVELARDFPRVPAVSQALASVFQRRQLPERALEQYTQLSQLDDLDGEALMWRLELNRGLGRADEARTLARALVERRPDVSGHRLALARLLEDLGDITGPAGADAVLNRAIAVFPRNADVTREGGAFLLRQGHEARGLARLHRSLVLRPHQPELRERLTYLERGKGGFEQDWRLDPRAVAAAVGPAKADGPDSEYLLTQRVTRLFKDGTTSTWTQHVYRLNRLPSGDRERAWSVLYDPSRQSVVVLNARRLRPGAPDVDAEQTDSALGEAWYGLYYEQRATTVSFADLEPGDVVVVEHRLADFGRSLYGRTFGDLFALQDREPRHRVRVAWIAPEDLNLGVRLLGGTDGTQAPPTKSVANGSRTVAWDLRDVPALEPEAGMPGYTQVGLYVHASTFDSWDAVAQWYRELVATQLEPSAAVTREAQTLTAGLTDPADKVAVLHQFVAQRIRYVGLEFGEHGYKPYSVAEILERRFGDCKDKASLLSTMLSVVGIKSELVLVRTRPQGRISEEATSPAVFDHAILYVPSLDTFLDATAGYNGMAELPIDDQGASALVVTPTGGRFISLPELSASANVLAREYDVQLRASETRMDGSMRASGAFAAPLRDILAVPASRREQFESMLVAEFPGIQLDGAVFDEVTALNKPVRLRFSGLLPSGDGAVRLLQPGLSLAGLAQTTSRRHPLRVAHPFVWRWSFHVHEEDGLRAVAPEPVAVKSAFGRATLTSRRSESGLDIDLEVAIEAHGVGIDKYPEFRRFILEAGSALSRAARLEVRREP